MRNFINLNNLSILILKKFFLIYKYFPRQHIFLLSLFGLRFEATHFIGLEWDISLSKLTFGYSVMGS